MITTKSDFRIGRGRLGEPGYVKGNLRRRGQKGIIWARFNYKNEKYHFSTGKTEEAAARAVAWAKFEEARGTLPVGTVPKRRNTYPTVGEIVDRYREGIFMCSEGISERAVRRNWQALRSLVRVVVPRAAEGDAWRQVRISELTVDARNRWIEARRVEAGADLRGGDTIHNARLNAIWMQIRSVFGRQAMLNLYRDLKFPPEFDRFLRAQQLKEPARKWVPLPAASVEALQAEMEGCMKDLKLGFVIYELARWAALRSGEIQAIRRHWFVRQPDGNYQIEIITRRASEDAAGVAFRPKAQDGRVMVDGAAVELWLELCGQPGPTDLLIPTHLWEDTKRELMEILRRHIDRRLPLHELRKQAGSEVATRENSLTAAAEYIRDSIAVAERHYASLLQPVAALSIPRAAASTRLAAQV